MNIAQPYFIVIDILEIKHDIINCVLLVYETNTSDPNSFKAKNRPDHAFICEFSDQSANSGGDGGAESSRVVLRPYRIWDPPSNKNVRNFHDSKFLKKILKNASYTIIPNDVAEEKLVDLRVMYKDMQLGKIFRTDFCYLCRKNNAKYIFLKKDEIIALDTHSDKGLCEGCAWNVLLNRLDVRGVKVTPGLREILITKFKKIRDIAKIERNFDPSWNPIEDSDFSLYDVQDLVTEPYEPLPVAKVQIDRRFKNVLKSNNILELLPVQVKAIDSGLLEGKNLLIASSTSSGKTLIGELAGINNILNNKGAFLFVVPLVALANQKFLEFKKKYAPLGLRVMIRVGKSRIDKSANVESFHKSPSRKADIIIGTYEGVDFLFRTGNMKALPPIATVVIDEIQMFRDEDRGKRLDGFIARMKMQFENSQYIYLSATVANPSKLSRKLKAHLVEFFERPVPLERHVIPCLNETEKLKLLAYLVKKEFKKVSSYGFRGQSIIFTNSRKSVHELANHLRLDGLRVDAYHSGLTYDQRLRVERHFERQQISAVVTTAALGAGVDLPASQVIFHSLTMGIEWLTVAEFNQMLGRAGRFQKHDMGKVYLLVEPGKSYSANQTWEEDKVAIRLLTGKMQETSPPFNLEKSAGEVLAFISMMGETKLNVVKKYQSHMLGKSSSTITLLNYLHDNKLISIKDKGEQITILPIGRAICESFLDVEDGVKLKGMVKDYKESILDIASIMNPLKNVYLTNAIVSELSRKRHGHGRVSSKFFGSQLLDFMSLEGTAVSGTSLKRKKLSQFALGILAKWSLDIFNCECDEKPFCDCGIRNLAKIILKLRRKQKMVPKKISMWLKKTYEIQIYTGDIYDFLDSILHGLDAIERFANIFGNKKMVQLIKQYHSTIENP
ncbi:MAG: DEAD/DEAH box helicase [Promethearchaeota archaeon]